ncbi:invertebrate-type lysozyme 6-like [Centruroides vittatus]|uniref:invertebrate-type lysozyme 6-like n=1 Tax=Centruroides vittatus TaxID=120091 RepID=UPI003510BC9D
MSGTTQLLFILFLKIVISTAVDELKVEQICLDCICQAISDCNMKLGCTVDNDITYCGPYYISKIYWIEAGQPGFVYENDDESYRKCTQNKTCADQTIRSYMHSYGTDCNGNGIIDCADLFRIHRRGKTGCREKSIEKESYWLFFLECYLNNHRNPRKALNDLIS